jgi:mRNA-degrading endonuclease HigB of HigAB toxin-antitoxin module
VSETYDLYRQGRDHLAAGLNAQQSVGQVGFTFGQVADDGDPLRGGAFRPSSHASTVGHSDAAARNSFRGTWTRPRETASRRKNSASVQSITTRAFRLKVGTRDMWYVRCRNQAGQPFTLMPNNWATPAEVKETYGDASILKHNRVVFNIAGNKFRLVARINYPYRVVYVRFVGTHEKYDDIDAETI